MIGISECARGSVRPFLSWGRSVAFWKCVFSGTPCRYCDCIWLKYLFIIWWECCSTVNAKTQICGCSYSQQIWYTLMAMKNCKCHWWPSDVYLLLLWWVIHRWPMPVKIRTQCSDSNQNSAPATHNVTTSARAPSYARTETRALTRQMW